MESRTPSGVGESEDLGSEGAFSRVFCDVGWKVVQGRGVRGEGKPSPAGSRYVRPRVDGFFRNFGVLGTARDLILAAFWVPAAAFWWSGRVLGIYCNIAALAGWPGGVPGFR